MTIKYLSEIDLREGDRHVQAHIHMIIELVSLAKPSALHQLRVADLADLADIQAGLSEDPCVSEV